MALRLFGLPKPAPEPLVAVRRPVTRSVPPPPRRAAAGAKAKAPKRPASSKSVKARKPGRRGP